MRLRIIAVGKNKHQFIKEGINYYQKQIDSLEIIEVNDGKNAADVTKEGLDILAKISDDEYVIALAILGKEFSSEQFAQKIDNINTYHSSKITFVIGGSHGLSPAVLNRAQLELSFSKMTLPHLLMRLVLVEQIYRALMINNNHPYHK